MKKLILLFLLMGLIFLGGCWDMREINDLGLVMAVGIDRSLSNPSEFLVTVQVANPKPSGSDGETSKAQESVWIASAEGETIFEAIRKIARFSSHRIMWAHNNIIIVGESLAKDDITPVIDFFTHNFELRMKTWIAVAQGNANDYLAASVAMSNVPGQSLGDVFRYQEFTGLGLPSHLLKVYGDFTSESTNILLAALSLNQAVNQAGLAKRPQNTSEQIQVAGMAVFDKTRMLGYLSADETRGLAWLFSQNPNMLISVPHPENNAKSVAIEIRKVKVKINSQLSQNTPEFTIDISGTGSITEEDSFSDLSISEFKSELETLLEQQIVKDVELSLSKVQKEFKSDVLGFGQIVHAEHKQEWNEKIKNQWTDIYPEVEIKVGAKITIESSTIKQIPLRDYKEKASTYDQN